MHKERGHSLSSLKILLWPIQLSLLGVFAMSSLNDCIKFHLNIEDPNIIFSDYFKKYINGKYHNLYVAELIQSHCPYCLSSNLVIILLTYALLLLMLAIQLLSDLKSSAFCVMPTLKAQWLSLILLIKAAISLTLLSEKYFLLF